MTRTATLALLVVVVAGLLAGGVVLAKDIQCLSGKCVGTKKADEIVGSFGPDTIFARGGNDTIFAESGDDEIYGGGGNDRIIALGTLHDSATIFGGKGDDVIDVRTNTPDKEPDFVDCGPGTDTVVVDPTDTRLNCEILGS